MKKWTRILVAMLFAVLTLTACAKDKPQPDKSNDETINQAEKPKELVMAFDSEPDAGFDPVTGWGRYGSPLFQSTLLKRNDDLEVELDLAVSYEVDETDHKVWTVKLRDDVTFTDGEPVTATDVVYTFEQASASGSVVDLNVIDKVEAIDETTVKFTLTQPQSTFVNMLIATGIVPAHAHGEDYALNPIGSGPYKMLQYDKGEQLIVEANPDYYGDQPYFEKVTFAFLSEDTALAAAKAGEVDMTYVPASLGDTKVPGMKLERVETVDNRGIAFPFVKSGEKTEDGIPIGNDVTSDVAIRKAINIAVDREVLVEGILNGYGTPAYSSADKLPWWNEETVIEDGDMEGAKQLLDEAGWKEGKDGIREKDGLKAEFKLYYLANDEVRQSLSIAVADMMKELGINIIVEGGSWDVIGDNMFSEAVLMGWGSHDPHELYNIYAGVNAGIDFNNTGYYKNDVVDAYFQKALAATTEEEANEFWKKAQWDGTTGASANGDAPWAWLVNIDHLYLVDEALDIGKQRIHVHGHGWPVTDNIERWKWKE